MTLRIYFLRHGETPHSQRGAYCGVTDPDLTSEGREMARLFADCYSKLQLWEAVYASPMKRTLQTVQPFCHQTGLPVQTRDGLQEIAYGAWEDREQADIQHRYYEDYLRWLAEPAWNAPTGGQTAVQVASRAMPVIAEIQAQNREGNVLVVSHKATIRIILCSLLGIDLGRYRDRIDTPAGSISVIKFDTHGPMLEKLGDRHYLPDHLRNRQGT
jgi:broad specificity phosphatase PhoE